MGWDGEGWVGLGWVGGGKNHPLGHSMNSYDAHTVPNNTTVGHIARGSKCRSSLSNWCPPWVPLQGRQSRSGRSGKCRTNIIQLNKKQKTKKFLLLIRNNIVARE